MFLKGGAFRELVLLSLNEGTTRLDNLFKKLSIFSKEEIVNELVYFHNTKVIEFDVNNKVVVMTKKMKDTIDFLVESDIVKSFNTGRLNNYLNDTASKADVNFNDSINAVINKCLSYLYRTDFSNEISVLNLDTEKRS